MLLHAVCDALLGALSLGDIGKHFKNTDPQWKGTDSKYFLEEVSKMIGARGYAVGNIDATLILEEPKIGKYIPEMKKAISGCLGIEEDAVSIKATTSETMGFVGRKEGLEAHAVCILYKKGV
ncbi:2-C-methyl-D-erythritol 2,4-cyclodiphosphate synthase [compost metagenome]